jgi:hypothetical protein
MMPLDVIGETGCRGTVSGQAKSAPSRGIAIKIKKGLGVGIGIAWTHEQTRLAVDDQLRQ